MLRLLKYGVLSGLFWMAVAQASAPSLVPSDQQRSAEQTLLTYPEWFLVHSPAQYARTLRQQPSQDFPFVAHVGQLWSSYYLATREQWRGHYPSNPGYHVMIVVLASSTTLEYGLRAAYENTLGRISWALGGNQMTAEDRFAAQAAQEYVDFIRQQPWYLFDFRSRLTRLWRDVPLTGPGLLRKWERRYALTTEYLIKAAYGKLIEKATRATYEVALMNTDVVIAAPPAPLHLPARVDVLKNYADGRQLLSLPRYFDFRIAATALAQQGVRFDDIAGNQGDILVTLWQPDQQPLPLDAGRILFTQAMAEPRHIRRVGVLLPVAQLADLLRIAPARGWQIEHVHDY
ncbi:hypothetical protein [Amantichitinum ursilacus]|uniref:Uncharacterized protein n=1 Tax=Amantichitinum ursilacus TaxID=857265 RepID=A0A0N1JTX8_9NEIS|nr:hypothetical protein [Amantichitinum ursilacus]KPC55392.1 hypothetical protein WG78_02005 [Amantichitinum ursilacus]